MRFETTIQAAILAALMAAAPALAQTTTPQAAPKPQTAAGAAVAPVDPVPAAAAAPTATAAPAGDTAPVYGPQKAVYHVNGNGGEAGKAYDGVLGNLRNHLDAVGDGAADLRVVMNGDGVGLLQKAAGDQTMQGKIVDLKNRGVRFLVCNNTLTQRKIDPATLFDVDPEDIVPAGVAELTKLQGEGFAYIKP